MNNNKDKEKRNYYAKKVNVTIIQTNKIVISLMQLIIFTTPVGFVNPAGIQFVSDIYRPISDLMPTPFETDKEGKPEEVKE